MKQIKRCKVESDPRSGDGGGRLLALAMSPSDASSIAKMLGGMYCNEAVLGVIDDEGVPHALDMHAPIYPSAWKFALDRAERAEPRVGAWMRSALAESERTSARLRAENDKLRDALIVATGGPL